MARNSSEAWTPALEKDGEEKPRGLFLILLIWEEGGALVSFERFYRCLSGSGEGAVCRARCAKTLSVPLLPPEMGLPVPAGAGQVLCWGRQLPQEPLSVRAQGGEITLLLPRGLGNVHRDGPSKKSTVFLKCSLGER